LRGKSDKVSCPKFERDGGSKEVRKALPARKKSGPN